MCLCDTRRIDIRKPPAAAAVVRAHPVCLDSNECVLCRVSLCVSMYACVCDTVSQGDLVELCGAAVLWEQPWARTQLLCLTAARANYCWAACHIASM